MGAGVTVHKNAMIGDDSRGPGRHSAAGAGVTVLKNAMIGDDSRGCARHGAQAMFEHCFVTNEVPFRFQEKLMVRFEPQKRDLQFYSGPRASNKQGSWFSMIYIVFFVFALHAFFAKRRWQCKTRKS